jgi:adenosine kinase
LLVDGAAWLFTNEYEAALLSERTGWSARQILDRVGTWVTTLGAQGVRLACAGQERVDVPAVPAGRIADPTGAGDAFRAGFLAGLAWAWAPLQAARFGCALAATVLESVGTQEYKLLASDLIARIGQAYGDAAARAVEPRLSGVS